MANDESLFTALDKKAKEAGDKQRQKTMQKINDKVDKSKKGQSSL